MKITIADTTSAGEIIRQIEIAIDSEWTTVGDIILARVYAEVDAYNEKSDGLFQGLVQPTESEKQLNGFKLKAKRSIDAEQQTYIALDAFKKNGFFVLIDDQQAESLEQEVLVAKDTSIQFIQLTPLVGG